MTVATYNNRWLLFFGVCLAITVTTIRRWIEDILKKRTGAVIRTARCSKLDVSNIRRVSPANKAYKRKNNVSRRVTNRRQIIVDDNAGKVGASADTPITVGSMEPSTANEDTLEVFDISLSNKLNNSVAPGSIDLYPTIDVTTFDSLAASSATTMLEQSFASPTNQPGYKGTYASRGDENNALQTCRPYCDQFRDKPTHSQMFSQRITELSDSINSIAKFADVELKKLTDLKQYKSCNWKQNAASGSIPPNAIMLISYRETK